MIEEFIFLLFWPSVPLSKTAAGAMNLQVSRPVAAIGYQSNTCFCLLFPATVGCTAGASRLVSKMERKEQPPNSVNRPRPAVEETTSRKLSNPPTAKQLPNVFLWPSLPGFVSYKNTTARATTATAAVALTRKKLTLATK